MHTPKINLNLDVDGNQNRGEDGGVMSNTHLGKNDDLFVEYVRPASGEEPFNMRGTKWQFCWCRYANGRIDMGIYSFAGDVCFGYWAWQNQFNLN